MFHRTICAFVMLAGASGAAVATPANVTSQDNIFCARFCAKKFLLRKPAQIPQCIADCINTRLATRSGVDAP